MRYIIDAYAWIEYLEGSMKGEKVNNILKTENEIFVVPITIAEVVGKVKRKKGNSALAYQSIITKSKIVETTPKIAKEASLLYADIRNKIHKFGIVDALIITSARNIGAKVLTGDSDFRNFKEVELL